MNCRTSRLQEITAGITSLVFLVGAEEYLFSDMQDPAGIGGGFRNVM